MKAAIRICLAAFLLQGASAPAQDAAPAPAPKIVCDEPTFNFGEVDNSKDVEHTFILRNEGNVSLEIARARPTCGCTVANISQKTVPPGGQTEVSTRLSLRGRQGAQKKSIYIESNDPQQSTYTLYLEGTAVSELQVQPTQVFFGRINSGAVATGAVQVLIQHTNPVAVTALSADNPLLGVAKESLPDGKSYRLLISTKPPLPTGTLRGTVHMETDHPKYPAVDIQVSAFVVGSVTVAPEQLTLTENEGNGAPQMRFIIVKSETGQSFTISAVEPPLPGIQHAVLPIGSDGYRIEITNILPTRELSGTILRIRTTLPEKPEIEIPIQVLPAPAPQS